MPAPRRAQFGRLPWVYQGDDTTGACSLVRESLNQVAPSSVQNTLCEVSVNHARDREVFERDPVVAFHQIVR